MSSRTALSLFAVLIAGGAATAAAQTVPKILGDPATRRAHPLPDFSFAGYGFGIAPLPGPRGEVIDVTRYGAVPDDGLDDSKAVQKALVAARAVNGAVVVRFPRGRFQITEVLRLDRSNIVLDGAGSQEGGTELWFPRPLELVDASPQWDELRRYFLAENKRQVEPENNIDYLFSEWSWSGGFIFTGPRNTRPVSYAAAADKRDPVLANGVSGRQFARTLSVDRADKLHVGDVVQLQWFAGQGAKSAILRSMYGDTNLPIGSHHWSFPNRPTVSQSTRITKIVGNTVTLGDPLLHDVRSDQPAVVAHWEHLTNVGIQNMALRFPDGASYGHHLEQGFNGIYLTGVFDGWIANVRIDNADSGVLTDNAANLTIKGVTTTGARRAHYAVHLGAVHNALVTGLKVENPVVHPLTVNTRSTRSVFTHASVASEGLLDQHSGSNHQNLFDDLTLNVRAQEVKGAWVVRLWEGGGAPYWKPGHGLYNTAWNIRLVPVHGPAKGQPLKVVSGLEGPGARIVGIWSADHPVSVTYTPEPYAELIGEKPSISSLYEAQLARRIR